MMERCVICSGVIRKNVLDGKVGMNHHVELVVCLEWIKYCR